MGHENRLRWRLALDLGAASLGWAVLILNKYGKVCGIARAGVRLFGTGRSPKNNQTLAAHRREKRQMRRNRDRRLKRYNRQIDILAAHGFVLEPKDLLKNPYALRARALDSQLTPSEFARTIHHLSKRRGFNARVMAGDEQDGCVKDSINATQQAIASAGARTFGEWLHMRQQAGQGVRARASTKGSQILSYALYPSRQMIKEEFEKIWQAQAAFAPEIFTAQAHERLFDAIFFQRPLRPVTPGRCTLLPDEIRAPVALPIAQRFRIVDEVNRLQLEGGSVQSMPLTQLQREQLIAVLSRGEDITFAQARKLLLGSASRGFRFNMESASKTSLKGDATAKILSQPERFGELWHTFDQAMQHRIVTRLFKAAGHLNGNMQQRRKRTEKYAEALARWLCGDKIGVTPEQAQEILSAPLLKGYGSLSTVALQRIVPFLEESVVQDDGSEGARTYDQAVRAAGFESHSAVDEIDFSKFTEPTVDIAHPETGELRKAFTQLPYYARVLPRHVSFGSGDPLEIDEEKRYGRVLNPTVHIGLNQVRQVVNALIRRYGNPDEAVAEVARELKLSLEEKERIQEQQAYNKKRNDSIRKSIAARLGCQEESVSRDDIQKWILWEELNPKEEKRFCPYSGQLITPDMLFNGRAEVEHILPRAMTLDDSLNNLTVCMREANDIKRKRTPWEAREDFERAGWSFSDIVRRAKSMPKGKRWRFKEGVDREWIANNRNFMERSLNDTRYVSKATKDYLKSICPWSVWVIPGQMTAMLRRQWGLNSILGDGYETKSRDDHRHHAIDACVIGCIDRSLLQKIQHGAARAAGERPQISVSEPWQNYRKSVENAIAPIKTSYKREHAINTEIIKETAFSWPPDEEGLVWGVSDGKKKSMNARNMAPIPNAKARHATNRNWRGSARWGHSTKSYDKTSYAFAEVVRDGKGAWQFEFVPVLTAVEYEGKKLPATSLSGKPLVMRLRKGDVLRLKENGASILVRVDKLSPSQGSNGMVFFTPVNDARDSRHVAGVQKRKSASGLEKAKARLMPRNYLA